MSWLILRMSSVGHVLRQRRSFSSSVYLDMGRGVVLFDPAKEELVTVPEKVFPQELDQSRQIGSCQGWGIFSNDRDRSVCMSNVYHPLSNPKLMIPLPLPPQAELKKSESSSPSSSSSSSSVEDSSSFRCTSLLSYLRMTCLAVSRNFKKVQSLPLPIKVAMSSSPSEEDCVVAIMFSRKKLCLCRPHRDLSWTETEVDSLLSSDYKSLMFSNRDQRFYLSARSGELLYSWDLHFELNQSPELHQLLLPSSLPYLSWENVDGSCDSSSCLDRNITEMNHLVESTSSNQLFLVQWYTNRISEVDRRTVGFKVFREEGNIDEGTLLTHTKDIGDLCIFLSKGHAFCIPASSCSGLKPNSIYFAGHGVGIYHLADGTVHPFQVLNSFKDGDWVCSTT
ncbi:hypothetical protein HA466_0318700 [Hirschfeldia incana]|nr:hypothetical protein HA466_0318690 [Hirschfeldia incana]KAJ0229168.1 hypothetical protein HA466_0318700 [Hirschfeldia incana]